MRNANQKGRCTKRALTKFKSVCKTYDPVQDKYANHLESDPNVLSVQINVLLDDNSIGEFTSDFLVTFTDGSEAVRECVFRKNLLKPRTIKLLDFSQKYWFKHGITDWKVIIDAETE